MAPNKNALIKDGGGEKVDARVDGIPTDKTLVVIKREVIGQSVKQPYRFESCPPSTNLMEDRMEVDFLIIGGGLSGLMAAAYFKELGQNKVVVVESKEQSQAGLSQHKAVMRLRTPAVAELLGLKTEKILVQKAVYTEPMGLKTEPSIRDANIYSQKVAGIISPRSIGNLGEVERYRIKYHPHHVANHIPTQADVLYTSLVTNINATKRSAVVKIFNTTTKEESFIDINYQYCISTLPLFKIASIISPSINSNFQCKHNPIQTKAIHLPDLPMDQGLEQTVYIARETPVYRITLRPAIKFITKNVGYKVLGSELIIESMEGFSSNFHRTVTPIVRNCFGVELRDHEYTSTDSCQPYGKLTPISDDKARRAAIFSLTQEGAIYSLGRHAIWKSITADNVLVHLKRISKMLDTDEIVRKSKSKSMEAKDEG